MPKLPVPLNGPCPLEGHRPGRADVPNESKADGPLSIVLFLDADRRDRLVGGRSALAMDLMRLLEHAPIVVAIELNGQSDSR